MHHAFVFTCFDEAGVIFVYGPPDTAERRQQHHLVTINYLGFEDACEQMQAILTAGDVHATPCMQACAGQADWRRTQWANARSIASLVLTFSIKEAVCVSL